MSSGSSGPGGSAAKATALVRRDGRGDALFSAEARSGCPELVEGGVFEQGGVGKSCASGVSVGLPLGGMP